MEYAKIEQHVVDLLEISGIGCEDKEQPLRQALFHMLMAAGIMDTMTDEEKAQVARMKKHFDFFFSTCIKK